MIRRIELLAPARDAGHGIAALEYGADAVYIGAPRFGARAAAGNSVEEIARLAGYAHRFGARVFVALNTILYDNELDEARRIAHRVWDAGADALIVQDMALAQMELPPIPLHASTQTFNLSPEKIAFFEKAGFSRVILERAVRLDEIGRIRQTAGVELEAFVHGAVCVCYSGQCYMSRVVSGRSGNRGECAQPCRWDYRLTDEKGRRLISGKHLLSVNDLNLSDRLETLIDAGVTSFKIEGRLKDMTYLKNSTAHYRRRLDEIIARRQDLVRGSEGETAFDFDPDPEKSFSRGFMEYFLFDPDNRVSSFDTPKSTGRYIGEVLRVRVDSFELDCGGLLSAGDGICFLSNGALAGTNVNRTEGNQVWPNRMEGISPGLKIYRNYDRAFARSLERSKTRRMVAVRAQIWAEAGKVTLRMWDAAGNQSEKTAVGSFDPAQNPSKAEETIRQQTARSGDTMFRVEEVTVEWDQPRFVPASVLNGLRRETLEALEKKRLKNYRRRERPSTDRTTPYPWPELDYRANVTNHLAEAFYRKHGVTAVELGFERQENHIGQEVMRTRYCIRREIGQCLREKSCTLPEPLMLENDFHRFALRFDCAGCEMALVYAGKQKPGKT